MVKKYKKKISRSITIKTQKYIKKIKKKSKKNFKKMYKKNIKNLITCTKKYDIFSLIFACTKNKKIVYVYIIKKTIHKKIFY